MAVATARRLPLLGRVIHQRNQLAAELASARARLQEQEALLRRQGEELQRLREQLGADASAVQFVPPGHYYSPVPSLEEVERDRARIFSPPPRELPGIDLNEERQLELLRSFLDFYRELPFPVHRRPELRYWFENPAYSYSDAIFLYCMLRHARPRRIVEVGCGYSSCAILDTNERFLSSRASCTFIDPYPDLLLGLLRESDLARVRLLRSRLQDVPLTEFLDLEGGDVLVVDSTHVVKVGSDVQHLFNEILPRLRRGVYVHFHDVFYPFEYPEEWVREGRAWTEAYLLRAFLAFNREFEIVAFNTYLERFHRPWFERHMPLCLRNEGGSVWVRRR
ncbi:MAG TPA: class I SAM-dependent methyltransferase [Candidatus Dormibacteraeota bacterium]|nr:class I SAM-dependent methyltransferase [Candidatus Dormibacteraeota bacterium]